MGLDARKKLNLTLLHGNNKGADQPALLCSLISVFDNHCFESIVVKLATCKISIFYLITVAEQDSLSLKLYMVANPKGRFSCVKAQI